MSRDKNKPIPILDDVIRTGNTNKAVKDGLDPYPRKLTARNKKVKLSENVKAHTDSLTEAYEKQITAKDKKPTAKEEKTSRPIVQKKKEAPKKSGAQSTTKPNTIELGPVIDKIVAEMMPDLERHIRMQLRFELEKHLPKSVITSEVKNSDK